MRWPSTTLITLKRQRECQFQCRRGKIWGEGGKGRGKEIWLIAWDWRLLIDPGNVEAAQSCFSPAVAHQKKNQVPVVGAEQISPRPIIERKKEKLLDKATIFFSSTRVRIWQQFLDQEKSKTLPGFTTKADKKFLLSQGACWS